MSDRPAVDDVQRLERGRRLRALVADGTLTEHDVDAVWTYLSVCERLARAEQALAACSGGFCGQVQPHNPHRWAKDMYGAVGVQMWQQCSGSAALRASQGGQT